MVIIILTHGHGIIISTCIVAVCQPDQWPVDGAPKFPALAGCLPQVVAGAINGPVLSSDYKMEL